MRMIPFVLIILSLLVLTGCNLSFHNPPSEKVLRYSENFEIIESEKDKMLENVSDTLFETSDRSNSLAEEIVIDYVPKEGVKINVPSGRYRITGGTTGNIYIHDEKGDLLFHNIVGSRYGVESITVDLNENHTIFADGGFWAVHIIPVNTLLSTNLTAGIWEVGLDIEEGDYTITSSGGIGYLQLFNSIKNAKVYEVIGGEGSVATKSKVQLKDGQKIRITGISEINFEPTKE